METQGIKVGTTAHSAESSEVREPTELVQRSASRGVHIGARALLVIYLLWFGYIASVSVWSKGVYYFFIM